MTNLIAGATQAASAWGPLTAPPRLIGERENAVFEVTFQDKTRAALRLHRIGYQSEAAITSELTFTQALAQKGFPCPAPLLTRSQTLTTRLESGQIASAVSWIDGACIGADGISTTLYERLGALIRQMHDLTDTIDTTTLTRPSWSADALLGENPHWGRFWENPSLTTGEQDLLQHARRNAAQQLHENKGLETCLIHADLLQENILQTETGLHIIDFDDSGFGFKFFDLGTALIQHEDHPDLDALTRALCTGYGCDADLMPLFIMLRGLASCGWVISRIPADDPRQRIYAERALRCARRYLNA